MIQPSTPDPDIAVVIPAYDCAATIGAVVSGARAHGVHVVVVDDGSADDTAARAAAAGAELLRLPRNGGKGGALRAGMRHLAALGYRRALTMDGDGQHLASEIPVLIAASTQSPHALIIGERQIGTQAVSGARLFGNRFANRWVEIACGLPLPDTQSGLRVYPLLEILSLGASAERFAFETEVLIRAARAGVEIRSVPVRVYYPPPAERISHFRPWQDTVRIIVTVVGLILRRR